MKLELKITENKYYNVKEVLKEYWEISDRLLIKLKKQQKIFLNGNPTYVDAILKNNDIVSVNLDFEETSENIVPTKMNLAIIFEDNFLLIVNKPAGIPVHPSISHYEDSLSNGIKYYFNLINLSKKIRPINRLDKDTSGIVLFAKNEYIQESLVKQMKKNIFKKEYLAILSGILNKKNGIINAPISRKENSIIEREINSSGDIAITHFELQKTFAINSQNYSLVKFILETGRTHQIRLHSKYIGFPILGDTLYGSASELINRHALHAFKVCFIHPITKEYITLEIDLPEDIKNLLKNK